MRSLHLSAAVVLVCLAAPASVHAAPPPNDEPEGAIELRVGEPASASNAEATRGPNEDGGHSIWFAYTNHGADRDVAFDLAGSDFDTTFSFVSPFFPEMRLRGEDLSHPAAHASERIRVYGGGRRTLFRVDGAEPEDVGTVRIVLRETGPAPDRFATPAALDLADGVAVTAVSRVYAEEALEPGEPGDPGEGRSIWWRFVAPATGPVVLDTCLYAWGRPPPQVLRVLSDQPLERAQVIASRSSPAGACMPLEVQASAGDTYRVQATVFPEYGNRSEQVVPLRARASGTPPSVSLRTSQMRCSRDSCTVDVEALPAPGAPLAAVECRVDEGPRTPCRPVGQDRWELTFPGPPCDRGAERRIAARATDAAGRRALVKDVVRFAVPASPGDDCRPSPPQAELPPPPPSGGSDQPGSGLPSRLRAPRARFTLVPSGVRVRSLTAPSLPAGARVLVACRGPGCPFRRRTRSVRSAGPVALTRLFAGRLLLPGVVIEVRMSAPGARSRVARWRVPRRGQPRRRPR